MASSCAEFATSWRCNMTELRKATIHGYADRMSVAPGEKIEFKISCEESGDYRADVVRLIHGDTNPAGPGFKEEVVDTAAGGQYPGRYQPVDAGSCILVEDGGTLSLTGAFTLHAFVQPTTPAAPNQGVLGRFAIAADRGYALAIEDGAPTLIIGEARLSTGVPLVNGCWYSMAASFDPSLGQARLYCEPVVNSTNSLLSPAISISGRARSENQLPATLDDAEVPFTVAGLARDPGGSWVDAHFNGKIDSPSVWSRVLSETELDSITNGDGRPTEGLLAAWDFADGIGPKGITSGRVTDVGPHGLDGICVNFPARGMTGWNWEGIEERFTQAPEQYGAIHFHDDDIEDCQWETDLAWTLPDDFKSGVYALRVTLDEAEDHVPFFVLPPRGQATARALFLVPTASYLAYANERMVHAGPVAQSIFGSTPAVGEQDLYLNTHSELGLSTYDLHSDGSGVHYSSSLRPIISMRPKHRMGLGGPWQLPADLTLVDWLDALGFDYDVATDRELHEEGEALLKRYRVVLTGSHPEYYSREMLDAWEGYLGQGGRCMSLGANAFYWVINWHPENEHLMEVRKGEWGSRAWQAKPGEYYMETNGERSGLWRGRGRPPQKLFGVGFTSEGFDHSSYYVQMQDARDPRAAFIFEGIDPEERIGDFGLVGGGAAGYEIDRYELSLGTPPEALLLAYSEGHSDNYPRVVEEVAFTYPHLGGTMDPQVRADLVYFPTRRGGAVFSTSSISWCGSLPHNNYDNNISRMTANVLRRFLDEEPLE